MSEKVELKCPACMEINRIDKSVYNALKNKYKAPVSKACYKCGLSFDMTTWLHKIEGEWYPIDYIMKLDKVNGGE